MPRHQIIPWHQLPGRQCHDRIQREDNQRSAGDGTSGPLPLCFHAQVRACLFKGDFDLPTADEPSKDLFRFDSLVGAEEGLRIKLALWVAHQHPAQRHRRQAAAVPDGCTGGDLDDTAQAGTQAECG